MVQEKNKNIQKKDLHFKQNQLNNADVNIDEALRSQNLEILEEIITGNNAIKFYNLLKNPPNNPKREEKIKEALNLFPEPDKSTEIDVEL